MREILFRGKTTDRGEWVQGCYTETLRYNNLNWMWNGKNHFTVNPDTIGQYTGLTDKNGRKIFEGDIVRCYCRSWLQKDVCGYIVFGNACFSVQEIQDQNKPAMDLCSNFEIIGNIHDNPELLGGE